jgi:uncharacterized cupin superfamily protein
MKCNVRHRRTWRVVIVVSATIFAGAPWFVVRETRLVQVGADEISYHVEGNGPFAAQGAVVEIRVLEAFVLPDGMPTIDDVRANVRERAANDPR